MEENKVCEVCGSDIVIYERALAMQKVKIESQTRELATLNRVHIRDVHATKISEAWKFLWEVIIKKI